MITSAGRTQRSRRRPSPWTWWLASGGSLVWRLPLLSILIALLAWYGFRGLVHMAFLFEAHPVWTFVLAPLLLPFAAAPALCFWAVVRIVPAVWRSDAWANRRLLVTAGGPFAALLAAMVIDLVHINLIKMLGISLPSLPLDPY